MRVYRIQKFMLLLVVGAFSRRNSSRVERCDTPYYRDLSDIA